MPDYLLEPQRPDDAEARSVVEVEAVQHSVTDEEHPNQVEECKVVEYLNKGKLQVNYVKNKSINQSIKESISQNQMRKQHGLSQSDGHLRFSYLNCPTSVSLS